MKYTTCKGRINLVTASITTVFLLVTVDAGAIGLCTANTDKSLSCSYFTTEADCNGKVIPTDDYQDTGSNYSIYNLAFKCVWEADTADGVTKCMGTNIAPYLCVLSDK